MLDFIYIAVIALSLLCGLIFIKRSSHISYKLLLLFLLVTLFNEIFCYFLKKQRTNTHFYYNIYYYFRFPFLGFVFYRLLSSKKIVTIFIRIFWGLTGVLFFVCLYLYNGMNKLHTIYLLSGGLFVLMLCLFNFYFLLKDEDIVNPFKTRFFWISTGLFLYFLGILPFLGVINLLIKQDIIFANHQLIITKSLSIFLYSLIATDYFIQWKQMRPGY